MDNKTTYVYEGVEVKLTGRTAKRTIPSRATTQYRAGQHGPEPLGPLTIPTGRELILVEIRRVDEDMDWSKWVDPQLLFVVS